MLAAPSSMVSDWFLWLRKIYTHCTKVHTFAFCVCMLSELLMVNDAVLIFVCVVFLRKEACYKEN